MSNPNGGDGRNPPGSHHQQNGSQNIHGLQHPNNPYGSMRDPVYNVPGDQRRLMTPSHMPHHRAMSPMAHGEMNSGPVTRSSIRWQDTADTNLRNRMIQQIIRLLRAKKPEASQEWIKKLPDMAKKLEDNLFHQSSSQQDYSNPETLTRRLQAIALKITRDRKRQQQQQMMMQGQPPPLNHRMPPFDRRESVRSMRRSPYPMDASGNPPPGAASPFPHQERRPDTRSSRANNGGGSLHTEAGGSDRNKAMVLKQQQHRLLLLRHASRCTFPPGHCPATKHCEAYKRLWVHIASCRNQQCDTPHCVSSRYVLAHYHRCQEVHCAVCRPVRDAISKQNQMKMQQQQQQGRATSRTSTRRASMRGANGMEAMPPQNYSRHSPFSFQPPPAQPMPHGSPTPAEHGRSFSGADPSRMQTPASRNTDIESRMAELERRRKALAEKKRKEAEEEEAIQREYMRLQSLKSTGMGGQRPMSRSGGAPGMPYAPNPTNDYRLQHQDSAQSMSKRMALNPGVHGRPMPHAVPQQPRPDPVAVRKERLINSLKSMQNQTSLVYTFGIKEIEEHVKSLSYKCASSTSNFLKPTELRIKAISLLKMLMDEEFSWIFNKPVDPVDLGIPDYFDVIKRPMDLGTVKKNVESNYYKCLKDFANDVRLVFNNAMLYNPETGDVHGIARQYGFKFEKAYNTMLRDMKKESSMKRKNDNACKLCGGEKYTFEPPVYYCSGKCNQKIRRGAFFYVTPDNKQYYCLTCYNSWLKDVVMLEDGTDIPKIKLKKRKNDEVQEESWVECNMCKRWYHQICVLFNARRNDQSRNEPFYCPVCVLRYIEQLRADKLPQKADVKFSADDLPRSGYSDFLEMRVKRRVLEARKDFARSRKIPLHHVEECKDITIRVVSCRDVDLIPRAGLERLYGESHKYPKSFPHRVKCVLLFQKLDGVDVLILGLYTQVYGSDCPAPNARTLYIAYLDSVNFFTPSFCRTPVYQEILQSTLEFEKKRGITKTFIWVCPPLAGDDYILYCHPKDQKTPKAEMLRNWYFSLLEECRKRGVIVSIDNLYDSYFQRMCCVTSVPNFDGDYWPGVTEQFIQQLENEKIDPKSIAPRKKRTFSRNKAVEKNGNKKRSKSKGKKQNKSKKKKSKNKNKSKIELPPAPPPEPKVDDIEMKVEKADSKEDVVTESTKEITSLTFKPPKPLPCLDMPQQDALTVKIADVIQQMKDDFMVVYMHHICSSCNCDIDKPDQVYWLPEKYDAAAFDLDYTKNRYAPPYALCDNCFQQQWTVEYPDTKPCYDGLQLEKVSILEHELENVRGFGTSNDEEETDQMIKDAVKEVLSKLCEKVETDASASNIDENDDLFEEEDAKKVAKEENIDKATHISPTPDKVQTLPGTLKSDKPNGKTNKEASSPKPNLTVNISNESKVVEPPLASPRSASGQALLQQQQQPEEIITVLPEGMNAERRSAWVEPPCSLLQMKPFKTQVPEETIDTDAVQESKFFDTRQQFLSLCQGNKYQFDQLRRAKHSSMMVLYHLHNPDLPSFLHSCNNCRMNIVSGDRFSCKVCDDFDLCEKCSRSINHPHELFCENDPSKTIPAFNNYPRTAMGMKAAGMNRRYGQDYYQRGYRNGGASAAAPQPKIQAHMALLVHASNCQQQNCGNKHCSRMRQLLKHGASCKVRVRGQCKICKRIWGLLHLHSRHCKVKGSCNVPGCNKLRAHLRRQDQHQDRRIRMHTQRMQQERMQAQQIPPQHSPMGAEPTGFPSNSPSMDVQRGAKHGKHLR